MSLTVIYTTNSKKETITKFRVLNYNNIIEIL